MAAQWPSAVSTNQNLYTVVNFLSTTLSGNINSVTTTISVGNTSGFPTYGGFTVDNEVIFYTGIAGNSFTGCVRGSDGTTAASHNSGVPVGLTIIAYHVNALEAEVIAIETDIHSRFGFGGSSVVTFPNGTVSAPSQTFAASTTTGFYSPSAGTLAFSSAGTETLSISGTQLEIMNGTVSLPAYSFLSDTDTGMYLVGADDLSLATNGISQFEINTVNIYLNLNALHTDGAVGSPGISFTNDTDCGLYRIGTDDIALATNGIKTLELNSSQQVIIPKTSNQLILGTTNTVTISSTAPSASRTYTLPDAGGAANFVLDQGSYTLAGQITLSNTSGNPIHGNTSGSTAATGYVGNIVESTVSTATNTGATGVYFDTTSITLGAGDWLITGIVYFKANGATFTSTYFIVGISTTSGNSGTGLVDGVNSWDNSTWPTSASAFGNMSIANYHVNPSTSTTYYLKAFASAFTSGTPQYQCRMTAIRIS